MRGVTFAMLISVWKRSISALESGQMHVFPLLCCTLPLALPDPFKGIGTRVGMDGFEVALCGRSARTVPFQCALITPLPRRESNRFFSFAVLKIPEAHIGHLNNPNPPPDGGFPTGHWGCRYTRLIINTPPPRPIRAWFAHLICVIVYFPGSPMKGCHCPYPPPTLSHGDGSPTTASSWGFLGLTWVLLQATASFNLSVNTVMARHLRAAPSPAIAGFRVIRHTDAERVSNS